ncbi:MAG: Hsp70 family protein, partial [Anaerolineales bacterium]|nr:Hsp70 family protein [Anaerolineales bacterium]
EEVEKMRQEAEAHADEDRKRKDLIESRNQADNSVYAAEKTLRDLGDKVPAEIKSDVEAAIADVRKSTESDNEEAIRKATESLGQTIQKISASVYQQSTETGTSEAGASETGAPGGTDDVIDGEVKDA